MQHYRKTGDGLENQDSPGTANVMVTSGFFDYENMPKVAYSPDLVRALGDLKAAIFLSQLLFYFSKHEKYQHERLEWYYRSREAFEDDTALSRWEQERARELLRKLGILYEKKGQSFHTYYKIDYARLQRIFPSGGITTSQVVVKPPVKWWQNLRQPVVKPPAAGGKTSGPLKRLKRDKKETERPGPVQADLAFTERTEIIRMFHKADFPWQKPEAKEQEK